LPMSKGCGVAVGDTSVDNPDPEPPARNRGQATRKGGWERGRSDEETWAPTRRKAGDGLKEDHSRGLGFHSHQDNGG
jgi:hypothetical protein